MNKTSFYEDFPAFSFRGISLYIMAMLLSAAVLILSCKGKTDQKAPEMIKDSLAAANGGGNGTIDSSTANKGNKPSKDTLAYVQGTKKIKDTVKTAVNIKNRENKKDSAKTGAANRKYTDDKANEAVKVDNSSAAKTDNTATNSSGAGTPGVFVSKYGVIPRNATENNITEFITAFPDKTILIKVNFDGTEADAEMKAVRTQIIKVLRNTGYTNVSDQSIIIEPIRMPKEIHFELQHNGSVVIWVPVANNDQ